MPFSELKKFKLEIQCENKSLVDRLQRKTILDKKTYLANEQLDSSDLAPNTLLFIAEGHGIRYVHDSEGNQQAVNLFGPNDILGTVNRFNNIRIPGGSRVIDTVNALVIPVHDYIQPNFKLMCKNLQYDLLYATSRLQMNSMNKQQKIYFILIELLRQDYHQSKKGIIFPKYLKQEVIAEFSGTTASYVSKIISELVAQNIMQKKNNKLICLEPDQLLDLSDSHRAFSSEDFFNSPLIHMPKKNS